MPADRVFRRTRTTAHTTARTLRHQSLHVSPMWLRRGLIAFTLGCIGLVIGIGITVFVPRQYFQLPSIRTLDCHMDDGADCPETIRQNLQPLMGQPLLFSNINAQLESRLTPIGVSLVQYSRILPDTLGVHVAPLDVHFYLDFQGQTTAITRSGAKLTVFNPSDSDVLVVRTEDQELGQALHSATQVPSWLLQLVDALSTFFSSTNTKPASVILRTPYEVTLTLVDQPLPIVINPQESALNLARLSTILKSEQYTEIATPGSSLDVRFRLPVLRR